MNNSKLVVTLQKLRPSDWKRFLDFLASPYHNRQGRLLELAKHLQDCLDSGRPDLLERHYLHQLLFDDKPFRLQAIKDQFSALQKLVRRFLALEHFREIPIQEKLFTLQQAQNRQMAALRRQQARSIEKLLSVSSEESEHTSVLQYQFLEREKEHLLQRRDRRSASQLLRQQINQLDAFYWKERLRLSAEWLSLDQVLQQKTSTAPLQEGWIALARELPHVQELSSVQLYSAIIAMLSRPFPDSEPFFLELIEGLQAGHLSNSSPTEIHSFFLFALNYCTARINSGNSRYYEYLFQLYEQMVAQELLLRQGALSQWTFINIVATGCHLQKFEWTLAFIHNHYTLLPTEQQLNALNYNLALLFFYQKAYDQALEYLPQVQYTDPYYALNSRVLQIRIFFEKQEWLLLDSLLERLRIYLLREKAIPAKRKQEVNELMRFTRQLAQLIEQPKGEQSKNTDLEVLRNEITAARVVMHRDWLLGVAKGR